MSVPELTPELLTHLAGNDNFSAGQALHQQQAVRDWLQTEHSISGYICEPDSGKHYRAELRWPRQQLEGSCYCPV